MKKKKMGFKEMTKLEEERDDYTETVMAEGAKYTGWDDDFDALAPPEMIARRKEREAERKKKDATATSSN